MKKGLMRNFTFVFRGKITFPTYFSSATAQSEGKTIFPI